MMKNLCLQSQLVAARSLIIQNKIPKIALEKFYDDFFLKTTEKNVSGTCEEVCSACGLSRI